MKEYKRDYPLFSLCGLNCGLCPRYHTDGQSKCPGCGGQDFFLKHPSCAVITCNKKHDNVEFCCLCSLYPCEKYAKPTDADSFITYQNVISDFEKAKKYGIVCYKKELDEKTGILEYLLKNYNDGKRKNFYCLAVNLLDLVDLRDIVYEIENNISLLNLEKKKETEKITALFEAAAKKENKILKLRKQP